MHTSSRKLRTYSAKSIVLGSFIVFVSWSFGRKRIAAMDGFALTWLKCWRGRATVCFMALCIWYISRLKNKGFSQMDCSGIKLKRRWWTASRFWGLAQWTAKTRLGSGWWKRDGGFVNGSFRKCREDKTHLLRYWVVENTKKNKKP